MGKIIGSRNFWTDDEIKYLKDNYLLKQNNELAEVLGRTRGAVQNKAMKLGIKLKGHRNNHPGSREWEDWEIEYIRDNGSKMRASEISNHLRRSYASVHHKMSRLGIKGWRQRKGVSGKKRDYNRWSWVRRIAIDRDDGGCVICGYDRHINVHHIVSVRDGGVDDIDNLVTLCPNCHAEADAGEIEIGILYNRISANDWKVKEV